MQEKRELLTLETVKPKLDGLTFESWDKCKEYILSIFGKDCKIHTEVYEYAQTLIVPTSKELPKKISEETKENIKKVDWFRLWVKFKHFFTNANMKKWKKVAIICFILALVIATSVFAVMYFDEKQLEDFINGIIGLLPTTTTP